MLCEMVTVASIAISHVRPAGRASKVCLSALLRRAAREGAVVVDLRNGRVYLPPRNV